MNLDWKEWGGGECPVAAATRIKYRMRGSYHDHDGTAGILRWSNTGGSGDIVAFAVPIPGAVNEKPYHDFARKDSNPKDVAGSARIDFSLLDPYALAELTLAMEEGRTKYGAYNYTVVGVKARTYVSAGMRHFFKWLLGEERDPKTGVHHLGSVMACAMILLSAISRSKLVDDRPPSNPRASAQLDEFEARVRHVREVFKGFSPHHYTIKDSNGTGEQIHPKGAQAPAEGDLPREDAQRVPGRDPGRVVLGESC